MKELSIEEKAKRYDEALKKAKSKIKNDKDHVLYEDDIIDIFPELKESEDERIRNFISNELACLRATDGKGSDRYKELTNAIVWLEKLGEQKLNPVLDIEIPFGAKDSELQEASYYIPEGFHAEIDGNRVVIKKGEQKPTEEYNITGIKSKHAQGKLGEMIKNLKFDKVEPKFKVGQTIKKESFNLEFTIVKIEDGFYYNDMGDHFPFTDQDNWELVEEPVSEEWIEELRTKLDSMSKEDFKKVFDKYAIAFKEEPVSEELEEAAHQYYEPNDKFMDGFKKGAKWQEKKDQEIIETAIHYAYHNGRLEMKEQMMAKAIDVEVKVDAGGYPYIDKTIELYDYCEDVPLAKEGDMYKVVLIKED